jgi:hypothetical protein
MNTNLTGGRLAAIIAGGAIASVAILVLLVGAGFQWLEHEKDADGYYTTSSERFSTGTYALSSDELDIDDGLPGSGDHYGNARLQVRSDDGKPVFVGVARTVDVDAYLSQSAHATLTDFNVDPFEASYRTVGGDRAPSAPGTQDFWAETAEGTGTQTLTWDVEDGNWSVVVMNADGSQGVNADISAGADLPIVGALATAFIITGLAGLAGGSALLAFGLIGPRRQTPTWPAPTLA